MSASRVRILSLNAKSVVLVTSGNCSCHFEIYCDNCLIAVGVYDEYISVSLSLSLSVCVSSLLNNKVIAHCVCACVCIKEITQNDLLLIIIVAVRAIGCVCVWGRQ